MRPSILATLVFLGLVGIGIRAQTMSHTSPRVGPPPLRERVAAKLTGNKPPALPTISVTSTWLSAADARQDALLKAQVLLASQISEEFPRLKYVPTLEDVNNLVKSSRTESFEDVYRNAAPDKIPPHVGGTDPRELRTVHLDLDLTADYEAKLKKFDCDQRSQERMGELGRGLAGLVLLLGVLAVYIRADEWTRGYYTGRLRLAALALTAAGGVGIWLV